MTGQRRVRSRALLAALLLCIGWPALASGSLRFFGNASTTADRVEIPLDAPPRPIDVGGSFTLELYLRALPGSNPVATACTNANDAWIFGNILLDRDVFGPGDAGDFGVALMDGRIAFGVSRGANGATACGSTDLRDGLWHHVALVRDGDSGALGIFVDGKPDGQLIGVTGDVSYRDGRETIWPFDPYLVLGNEKHFGPEGYSGWIDELRISRIVRYSGAFAVPSAPFVSDADTVGLYGFDEGSGTLLTDRSNASGGPSDGVLVVGGSPTGPQWSADTPFSLYADGFELP